MSKLIVVSKQSKPVQYSSALWFKLTPEQQVKLAKYQKRHYPAVEFTPPELFGKTINLECVLEGSEELAKIMTQPTHWRTKPV